MRTVDLTATTTNAPYSTVQRILELLEPSNRDRLTTISVYAPYHARSLYSDPDIDRIIAPKSENVVKAARPVLGFSPLTMGTIVYFMVS
jgi:hypothetical protein